MTEQTTIEIPTNLYNKLVDLANEYHKQDNRATAKPYLFQIRTTEEVAAYDGCGETYWFDDEGTRIEPEDEKLAITELKDWDKEEADIRFARLEDYEKEEIFENAGYRRLSVTTQHRYQNAFFTSKACKEHIEKNHYHYNEPVDYLNHAFRNPEMELISELFKVLKTK